MAMFMAITRCATPTRRASSTCSRVCGIAPSCVETTGIAASTCAAPVIPPFVQFSLHVVGVAGSCPNVGVVTGCGLVLHVRDVDGDPALDLLGRAVDAVERHELVGPGSASASTLVIAAVRVVFPWSTWPMVPMLRWGKVWTNWRLAMTVLSPCRSAGAGGCGTTCLHGGGDDSAPLVPLLQQESQPRASDTRATTAEPEATDLRRRERHQSGAMARPRRERQTGRQSMRRQRRQRPEWWRAAGGNRWLQAERQKSGQRREASSGHADHGAGSTTGATTAFPVRSVSQRLIAT